MLAALFFIVLLSTALYAIIFPVKYYDIVKRECDKYTLDVSLVMSVIWTESKFREDAVSSAGAVGLMQLLPSTAAWCAKQMGEEITSGQLKNAECNIRLGVFYLNYLMDKFGSHKWALAAYNAGEGAVLAWLNDNGEIGYSETRNYVGTIIRTEKIYKMRLKVLKLTNYSTMSGIITKHFRLRPAIFASILQVVHRAPRRALVL